ncbi:hypothetical protein AMECASPLE_030148 [Ameca splendens]|uniref:Uncharacterized protein n=1 Tax=Ameca splendens TaxID=208324 RepID=A0ABV0ZT01_9TELE
MTLFLCPGPRFKLLPQIRLPKCALPALTQFLSPDHCNLHFHWVNKPENLCDAFWLLPCHHPEEQKFSFLVPSWILKRFYKPTKKLEDQGSNKHPCVGLSSEKKVFTLEQEKFGSCKCIHWTANKGAINFCKTNGIVLQQPAKPLLQRPAKLLLQQPANPLLKKHSLTSPLSQYWSDPYQQPGMKKLTVTRLSELPHPVGGQMPRSPSSPWTPETITYSI